MTYARPRAPYHLWGACAVSVDMSARRCSNLSVSVRRAAVRISAIVVAILVGLALPVSQFRAVTYVKSCCCPDPDDCHCPDHKTDPSPHPTMRACHNTERAIVAPEAPSFAAPAIAVDAPVVAFAAPALSIPAPHPAPSPTRPDAPS